ncbi:MAG TPA: PP2C family protein-serine/threonine phosphatase [Acidimicrobiales bacterium]
MPTQQPDPSPSVGEEMLGELLEESHWLHPDAIPDVVRRHGASVGLRDVHLYLVDKEQRLLMPFPSDAAVPLDINSTLAGRSFRRVEVVVAERVVWFPLLDGAHRIGVMSAEVDTPDDVVIVRGRRLAALVAHLLITKQPYGDAIVIAQRREEMKLAAELRWAVLPPLTFASPDVAVSGFLEPAYDVAGDAFDYAVNGETLHLAVFDAMGHGLAASRLANLAMVSYRNSRRRGSSLEETYRAMDEIVFSEEGPDAFVTAQLVTLDIPSGLLRWINAGHPHPILLRSAATGTTLTGTTVLPVGLRSMEGEVGEMHLQPDDTLLFHSDGVTEARSPGGEEFGRDRLADMLVRAASSGEHLAEIVRRLTHAVLDHQQGHLVDDATLLLVHWPGSQRAPHPRVRAAPNF